jgi:hypothetical protein
MNIWFHQNPLPTLPRVRGRVGRGEEKEAGGTDARAPIVHSAGFAAAVVLAFALRSTQRTDNTEAS